MDPLSLPLVLTTSNLHCAVLYFQGTKGSPGQPGPAGEQGMRGPQVSEFTAEARPCLMMLGCYFITATSPESPTHKDCWDLGIFGCAVAWLSCLPPCSHQPRCDVFAKHPSDTAAFASPWILVCFCPCVLTASLPLFSSHTGSPWPGWHTRHQRRAGNPWTQGNPSAASRILAQLYCCSTNKIPMCLHIPLS